MSKYGVFSVPYFPVFELNKETYGVKIEDPYAVPIMYFLTSIVTSRKKTFI